ncbi:MAG: proline--tRNA ligase, partial [Clostridia bacterium]|nr:proline--tRNA ligase [Clostridia bacterium]
LIRVREFTMKDAYSFHTSQEDLERYYDICYKAYERIFARAGIPEVITVASDSGMMGGSISHEYMLLSPVGEDSIAVCSECDYRANMEAAESIIDNEISGETKELELVYTPDIHTIEDICNFLKTPLEESCKAVVYQKNMTDEYVVIFVRGDLDINETKLTNYLGEAVHPAVITEDCGLFAGFIGPVGMDREKFTVLFDASLKNTHNLSCGANKLDHHYTGLCISRDIGDVEYIDLAKIKEGGICPKCGKPAITISRGIEVGNIFQLGTKYTKSMGMQYLDSEGNLQYPIMGCYGIGVGRLAASVCEAHHDEYGPIWPMSIAPWHVQVCCLRADDEECKGVSDSLYQQMLDERMEVIYDDRNIRPGAMFSDADLLGVPVRVIVSPRNLKEGVCEVVTRDKSVSLKVETDKVIETVKGLIEEGLKF